MNQIKDLEATNLRDNRYAVRPAGQLGTCGWHPRPWTVVFVTASSPEQAVRRAIQRAPREVLQ